MKQKMILKETDLQRMIKESVKQVLRESYNDDDAYMYNYNDAMSDRYEDLSVDSIVGDLKHEGGVDLGKCPHIWAPANWEDVLQYATEFGYKLEDVRECILKELKSEIIWIQKSIDAVKNWKMKNK